MRGAVVSQMAGYEKTSGGNGRDMGAMTLYLAFCGGLSAGGGFYMERKKLARRAAGAVGRGDFEGSRQQYRRIGGGAS